jgi:hypothetical protein
MRLSFSSLAFALLLLAGCGGRSREPETGQSGAAGGNGTAACASGKDGYQHKREQVLQTARASGCKEDADCGTLWESNACVSTCGSAVPRASIDAASAELLDWAKGACATCPPIPVPPCAPPGPLRCVQGQCAEGP